MKIIEWNCQGAFRTKNEKILELKPDLLIILECENEEKLNFGKDTPQPNDFYWYSKGKKGIGIFSYSDYKIKPLPLFNSNFNYIIPLLVYNQSNSFLIFAIWAMDDKENPSKRYIGQIWLAINFYKEIFNDQVLLIGDFNSNQRWDEKSRFSNHTAMVNLLSSYHIESLYHKQENLKHGAETDFTFFMHRNLEKKYHIDYIFSSLNIIKNGFKLTLGNSKDWITLSDHIPLILEMNPSPSENKFNYSLKEFILTKFNLLNDIIQIKYKTEIAEIIASIEDHLSKESIDNIYRKYELLKRIEELTLKL